MVKSPELSDEMKAAIDHAMSDVEELARYRRVIPALRDALVAVLADLIEVSDAAPNVLHSDASVFQARAALSLLDSGETVE